MAATSSIKGPWSLEEDQHLARLVHELGSEKWVAISSRLQSRTGKQCRERWHNHLDPSINKEPFSQEEDELILRLYASFGPKWAEMSKRMKGRPDNAIKNHFNTSLLKRRRIVEMGPQHRPREYMSVYMPPEHVQPPQNHAGMMPIMPPANGHHSMPPEHQHVAAMQQKQFAQRQAHATTSPHMARGLPLPKLAAKPSAMTFSTSAPAMLHTMHTQQSTQPSTMPAPAVACPPAMPRSQTSTATTGPLSLIANFGTSASISSNAHPHAAACPSTPTRAGSKRPREIEQSTPKSSPLCNPYFAGSPFVTPNQPGVNRPFGLRRSGAGHFTLPEPSPSPSSIRGPLFHALNNPSNVARSVSITSLSSSLSLHSRSSSLTSAFSFPVSDLTPPPTPDTVQGPPNGLGYFGNLPSPKVGMPSLPSFGSFLNTRLGVVVEETENMKIQDSEPDRDEDQTDDQDMLHPQSPLRKRKCHGPSKMGQGGFIFPSRSNTRSPSSCQSQNGEDAHVKDEDLQSKCIYGSAIAHDALPDPLPKEAPLLPPLHDITNRVESPCDGAGSPAGLSMRDKYDLLSKEAPSIDVA